MVTLVGAGPGGADLITIAGAKALANAEVVVFDRLADPELLNLAPRSARRIGVGKARGSGPSQGDINDVLITEAMAGRRVVRLKGGDPFVFGRGSEEVDALAAAGIAVEVIPGVSSALAAPALAGVPVTDRRLVSSFTVLTGHVTGCTDHEWRCLAESGSTLVVLMGVAGARAIAERLIAEGRDPAEPVAFIHAAGTASAATHHSTLGRMHVDGCPFASPTVIVIGAVAAVDRAERCITTTPPSPRHSRRNLLSPEAAPDRSAGGKGVAVVRVTCG